MKTPPRNKTTCCATIRAGLLVGPLLVGAKAQEFSTTSRALELATDIFPATLTGKTNAPVRGRFETMKFPRALSRLARLRRDKT